MSARSNVRNRNSAVAKSNHEASRPAVAEHGATALPGSRRGLSAEEQGLLLGLPVHDADTMRSYVKPHEGFERVAPLTLKRLASYPNIASALRIDLADFESQLQRVGELAEQEDIAYRLHRRAMENRLSLESELFRGLLKLNRFLQSSDDEELQRDFADLSEWVASRTEGARRRGQEEENEPGAPKPE